MSCCACGQCGDIIDTDFIMYVYNDECICDNCAEELYEKGLVDEEGNQIKQETKEEE